MSDSTSHLVVTPSLAPTPAQQRLEQMLRDSGLPPVEQLSLTVEASVPIDPVMSGPLGDQVNSLNEVMRQYGLRFELSEFDSRVITQVIDRETGDVVRQIPAEEMLTIAQAFAENQGRLLDDSA